jgi:hypothetical protein
MERFGETTNLHDPCTHPRLAFFFDPVLEFSPKCFSTRRQIILMCHASFLFIRLFWLGNNFVLAPCIIIGYRDDFSSMLAFHTILFSISLSKTLLSYYFNNVVYFAVLTYILVIGTTYNSVDNGSAYSTY